MILLGDTRLRTLLSVLPTNIVNIAVCLHFHRNGWSELLLRTLDPEHTCKRFLVEAVQSFVAQSAFFAMKRRVQTKQFQSLVLQQLSTSRECEKKLVVAERRALIQTPLMSTCERILDENLIWAGEPT